MNKDKVRKVTGAEVRGKVMRAYEHSKPTQAERYYKKRKEALKRSQARKNQPKQRRMIVDKNGNPIQLTPYQKKAMYNRAQWIKKRIQKAMLSYDQHWMPTEHVIRLLEKREHGVKHLISQYKDLMEAIGAHDCDLDIEKLRRRR